MQRLSSQKRVPTLSIVNLQQHRPRNGFRGSTLQWKRFRLGRVKGSGLFFWPRHHYLVHNFVGGQKKTPDPLLGRQFQQQSRKKDRWQIGHLSLIEPFDLPTAFGGGLLNQADRFFAPIRQPQAATWLQMLLAICQ